MGEPELELQYLAIKDKDVLPKSFFSKPADFERAFFQNEGDVNEEERKQIFRGSIVQINQFRDALQKVRSISDTATLAFLAQETAISGFLATDSFSHFIGKELSAVGLFTLGAVTAVEFLGRRGRNRRNEELEHRASTVGIRTENNASGINDTHGSLSLIESTVKNEFDKKLEGEDENVNPFTETFRNEQDQKLAQEIGSLPDQNLLEPKPNQDKKDM